MFIKLLDFYAELLFITLPYTKCRFKAVSKRNNVINFNEMIFIAQRHAGMSMARLGIEALLLDSVRDREKRVKLIRERHNTLTKTGRTRD